MKTTTTSVNKCERKKRFNVKIKDTLMFVIMKLCVCVCACVRVRESVSWWTAYQINQPIREQWSTLKPFTELCTSLHLTPGDCTVCSFLCVCVHMCVCVCVYARHPNFTSITTMTDTFINPGPQCVQYLMC